MSVQHELDRFVTHGRRRAAPLGPDYEQLWLLLERSTAGGRRFRPQLMLSSYTAFGGQQHEVADRVAAAIELLHTAFVIHDDLIDGDHVRRGADNVSGTFILRAAGRDVEAHRCATLGLAAGILAGDLALVGATREIALCGADAPTTRRLLDLLDHAVHVSAAGELADVAFSIGGVLPAPDLAEVISMEEWKTAVYSFQLPMQAGAVLAGAPQATVERLGEVGRLAGIGFQLLDDLRGVFGDEAGTGKSVVSDLREGKSTPLIAHARTTTAWALISPHIGDPLIDEVGAGIVRALLTDCGSRAHIESLAASYVTQALRTATQLGLPGLLVSELARLSRDVMGIAA